MKTQSNNYTKLRRFLVVRTDRIGDVILSLPVAFAIKQAVPEAHVTLLCRRLTAVIGERSPAIDAVFTADTDDGKARTFFELAHMIRARNFDCAIVLHPTFYLAFLLAWVKIPVRIGTGYRFYSFLFNRRHYEHRKESIKHEVDYNLGLLKTLNFPITPPVFQFEITDEDGQQALTALRETGYPVDKPYCVVHPGSGGSAMDWHLDSYAAASDLFVRELHLHVILTYGTEEKKLAENVKQKTEKNVYLLQDVQPLPVLAALLRNAEFLLAPSTGVLHLANMVATPVIGLYPPIRHESPVRWGPYGHQEMTLVPNIDDCTKCKKFNCMELITPEMVLSSARKIIKRNNK